MKVKAEFVYREGPLDGLTEKADLEAYVMNISWIDASELGHHYGLVQPLPDHKSEPLRFIYRHKGTFDPSSDYASQLDAHIVSKLEPGGK